MKVLVTGLSGVVGQAIIEKLKDRYEVSALSRYGTPGIEKKNDFIGDITEPNSILSAFKDQEVVVHLAADRSMNAGFDSTLKYNITGTYNVYEAARISGVRRVVYGSSQHVVGGFYRVSPYKEIFTGDFSNINYPIQLLDEKTPIRPSGFYGMSKVHGESLGQYYQDYHGISTISLRIGWTLSNDKPQFSGASLALWLSHRDTAELHIRAIEAPENIGYTCVFGTSNNYWKVFSLQHAKDMIGFQAKDDAGRELDHQLTQLERDDTEFKMHSP